MIRIYTPILLRILWGCGTLALLSVLILILIGLSQENMQFHSLLPADLVLAGLEAYGVSPATYTWLHNLRILLFVVFSILTGLLIFLRKPGEWITLYFSLVLIAMGVLISLELIPSPAEIHPLLSVLINSVFAAFFFSFYIFPDGHFVPRWTRWMALVWVAMIVSTSFAPGSTLDPNSWQPTISAVFYLILYLSCPAALIYRYIINRDFTQRQQIKWVTLGVTVTVVGFLAFWLPLSLVPSLVGNGKNALFYDLIGGTFLMVAYVSLPVSIGFALIRYRLWDIDPWFNRAIVYTSLTTTTIVIYILLVVLLGKLFQSQSDSLFAFIATGFVAVLFQPLRVRIQGVINRLMYGERDDPYAVISRLGQRLETALSPEVILPALVETVKEALRLPYVAITLKQEDKVVDHASAGHPVDKTLTLPLVYQNETVGELLLAPRSPGESFNPVDLQLLENLARQAGNAAHSLRLTSELQQARQHLVVGQEEERRRLRRDLHDGLGPHLASQSLTITAARQLLHHDPEAADALLEQAIQHAQTAVSDIRRVVYDLRPPALDDLGLAGALRAQVKDYTQSSVQISLDIPERLPPLPAAVEVACYRIAQEALTNVIRHAQATQCNLRITVQDKLLLEVEDDGCGIPGERHSGMGMTSMRNRAEELGGTFRLESKPDCGTHITTELPLT